VQDKTSATHSGSSPSLATGGKARKTSLFRRHSFNLGKEKSATPVGAEGDSSSATRESSAATTSAWYDGDVESEGQRSSATADDTMGGSFSDSEGGFHQQVPLRSRIRGLFGSFGKGRKRVQRTASKKPSPQENEDIATATCRRQPLRPQMSLDSARQRRDKEDQNALLKASLGEFTRQIESLSAKSEPEELATGSQNGHQSRRDNDTLMTSGTPSFYTVSLEQSYHFSLGHVLS